MKLANYKILSLFTVLILSSCGISKNSLGFGKKSPDEYSVLRQQPLTVPPSFDLVDPKLASEASTTTSEKEFDNIFHRGETLKTSPKKTPETASDKAFIKKTKQFKKKEHIKKVVTEEQKLSSKENSKKNKKGLLSNILS